MMATKIGSFRCGNIQVDGSTLDIAINKVKYLIDLCANLLSLNKALKKGFKLSNKGENISLTKGSSSISFDRIIKSLDVSVSGIKMVSLDIHTAYVAQNKLESSNSVDVNKFHEMILHFGLDCLKKTANVH
jgi:tRNA A37 threonylcarbamoyltransferase TsaD